MKGQPFTLKIGGFKQNIKVTLNPRGECAFFCPINLAILRGGGIDIISFRRSSYELVGWHAEFQGLTT